VPKESSAPVLIGVELFARRDDSLLLGLRRSCSGAGTWALPGGHLEHGEGLAAALCREAMEELGAAVDPADLRLASVTDDVRPRAGVHYVHVSFELGGASWEPVLMEPDRCGEWRWFPLAALPEPLFAPHELIIARYRQGLLYAVD
jgi:8-oxo-dGTP diphosphatase